MTFTIVTRERGRAGHYRGDLYLNGALIGRVVRAENQGGYRSAEYRATVAGRVLAAGRSLRDLRDELHALPASDFDLD